MDTDLEKWTDTTIEVLKIYYKTEAKKLMISSPDPAIRRLVAMAMEDPDGLDQFYDSEEGRQEIRRHVQEKIIPRLHNA